MLLLTGPPGSGKTTHVLHAVREALQAGRSDFRLLVPTATMAEHLRNELAREGFVFRPGLITAPSRFVQPWVEDLPKAGPSCLDFLVSKTLADLSPGEFQAVAGYPGFRSSLISLIEELSAAGVDAPSLERTLGGFRFPAVAAFARVYGQTVTSLEQRGLALESERLRRTASRIWSDGIPGVNHLLVDGFFTLSEPELELLDAVRRQARLTLTLPLGPGAGFARESLLRMGLEEKQCATLRWQPAIHLVLAGSIEQEAEDIARAILEEAGRGRLFRQIGIIVRTAEPYAALLGTTLQRFGIPAHLHFGEPLAAHPAVCHLRAAVKAMLGGWEHEDVLQVLRMAPGGEGARLHVDSFEFAVSERLPGRGLESLMDLAREPRIRSRLRDLARLERWRGREASPAEWTRELRNLTALCRRGRPEEPTTHEGALIERGHSEALRGFEAAVEDTAAVLSGAARISFREFWDQVETALRLATLRVPDRRRNVVHVMDVFEARQWELPVVFVCGLLERQFPHYHLQDPILPDEARRLLQQAGFRLRTAAERDDEERLLFEVAVSRATSRLVLSYPQFNEKGDENLRSFFLDEFLHGRTDVVFRQPVACRPRPLRPRAPEQAPGLRDPGLLMDLARLHERMSVSAIDTFLECPFRFFAERTLSLADRPPAPGDRLDALEQGTIAHAALARRVAERCGIEEIFRDLFDGTCRAKHVPPGYRTEVACRELLRDLQRFEQQAELPGEWEGRPELDFEFALGDETTLRGRLDRLDVSPDGAALVVDYKYSKGDKSAERIRDHEAGRKVQGLLYMLAAEHVFKHPAAGMLFAYLRGGVSWKGWHLPLAGLERIGTACAPEELREMCDRAVEVSRRAARQIREGRIHPAGSERCRNCGFRDVCRVETATKAKPAARGAAWT